MLDVGIEFTTLLFMLSAAFLSAVFHSVSGLAGALLLVITLSPILGIKTTVPLVAVAMIVSNVTRIWVFRRELFLPVFFSIIVTALPGMIVGAFIFVYMPVKVIALLLGIFLTVSVPGRRVLNKRGIKVGLLGFSVVGSVYGVVSGVAMGAGLVLAPFFLGAGMVGAQIAALTAILGVVLNITKTIVFGISPLLDFPLIGIGLIMGLCTMPGAFVGRWILQRTAIHIHTYLVEGVMLAGAVFFFSQALTS
jgi:uncharacterized membrane protein YfcA